jgi:hypothetical protein
MGAMAKAAIGHPLGDLVVQPRQGDGQARLEQVFEPARRAQWARPVPRVSSHCQAGLLRRHASTVVAALRRKQSAA